MRGCIYTRGLCQRSLRTRRLDARKIWTAERGGVRVYGMERRTGLAPRFPHLLRRTTDGIARQKSTFVTRLAQCSSAEDLDSEESELAEAGLVRLPDESLPESFWGTPAPQVSFKDAVSAVTSERDEG